MNRHALHVLSLVFGSAFLVAVAGWLLARWVNVDLPSAG
jgi:hypothetical protein